MPTSPTMKNTQEEIMTKKADDAWKYGLYQHRIINALRDVIRVEDEMWYRILHKRFIQRKKPVKIQEELCVGHHFFNVKQNEALLHFYNSCKMDTSIFHDDGAKMGQ